MYKIFFIVLFIIYTVPLYSQPLAQGDDKFLGAGTSSYIYRDFFKFWNQITPGNDGKWGSVEQIRGQYNWTNLDRIYNYAISTNLIYKHHVLVWGQQQPGWITSLSSQDQRTSIENLIKNVCERYPLATYIEVVNEPINAPPSYAAALGGNGTTGWDWVITAFQLARQYAPSNVKLLLNEYNLLHNNTSTNNYISIINLLKDRGLIDGVSIQGHYFEFRSDIRSSNTYVYDINTIKSNLNKITALGLPVYISEFDIDEDKDADQLAQYKIYFPIFWTNPGVKGITLWGYIEGDVWTSHPYTFLIRYDDSERPALQWLRTYIASPLPPEIVSPNIVLDVERNPFIKWRSSKSATSYQLQLSTNSVFATVDRDTTVTDTLCQMKPLTANTRYYWRVSAKNDKGASDYSVTASFITGDRIVSVNQSNEIPERYSLSQNYPNPFNPSTVIKYSIPVSGMVSLKVFDLLGREVRTLFHGFQNAGNYTVNYNGEDLSSGIYIYRLSAEGFIDSKKFVLLK
ncbi:MAG: T9SS type A sorting domain-containing protein [Ignavibacteria bacterium]|nr:T9SS type A sorting domain-containing protein [Ignavibacteria bacterium]